MLRMQPGMGAHTNERNYDMSNEPFNAAAHEFLLSIGYKHERVEAEWSDVGDAENGPDLVGHDGFDHYVDADSMVAIMENGEADFEWRDLELEEAERQMAEEYMKYEQYLD